MRMYFRSRHPLETVLVLLAFLLLTLILRGCILWTPVVVVPHPDAPALVTEVRRRYYRTAIYEKAGNRMLDAGWTRIAPETLVGRTISRFDWEAHIEKRSGNGDAE